MQLPRFDFKNVDINDRRLINNNYYEYLNKFNELSDKIIKSNQSYFNSIHINKTKQKAYYIMPYQFSCLVGWWYDYS